MGIQAWNFSEHSSWLGLRPKTHGGACGGIVIRTNDTTTIEESVHLGLLISRQKFLPLEGQLPTSFSLASTVTVRQFFKHWTVTLLTMLPLSTLCRPLTHWLATNRCLSGGILHRMAFRGTKELMSWQRAMLLALNWTLSICRLPGQPGARLWERGSRTLSARNGDKSLHPKTCTKNLLGFLVQDVLVLYNTAAGRNLLQRRRRM